jgi:transposase
MATMHTERFIGIDIHKRHVVVAAVDQQQKVLLSPKKISNQRFASWAHKHLQPGDQVALEATSNSWTYHDQLEPMVKDVVVANSYKLKLISASSAKTDKHDALVLAKLLAANLLPTVWVPPQHVRDLRNMTQHRWQLIQERTAAKNRLHAILHQHNIHIPTGSPFQSSRKDWWHNLAISPVEQLQIKHYWLTIQHCNDLLQETEASIAQLSVSDDWREDMTFLIQLPGIGLYTGMTILAAIGDIRRFPSPRKLSGYTGLGARVWATGNTVRTGKITKQGRKELRTALISSAWVAVRFSDYWRNRFQALAKSIGTNKAITAIARKILVVIWHVLTKRQADRFADGQAVARSILGWCSLHHLARSQGLRRVDFVRQCLNQLGLLHKVSSFRANGRTYYLPANP